MQIPSVPNLQIYNVFLLWFFIKTPETKEDKCWLYKTINLEKNNKLNKSKFKDQNWENSSFPDVLDGCCHGWG